MTTLSRNHRKILQIGSKRDIYFDDFLIYYKSRCYAKRSAEYLVREGVIKLIQNGLYRLTFKGRTEALKCFNDVNSVKKTVQEARFTW